MKDWEGMAFPKNQRVKNKKLIDEKQHVCEKCHKKGWTNKHHITSKGASGGDTEDNLIELCGSCHRLVHDGIITRKELKDIVKRRKGMNKAILGIIGRIQTRNYDDKDGKKVYVTEVVAEEAYFADTKKEDSPFGNQPVSNPFATQNNEFKPITDDDLPF